MAKKLVKIKKLSHDLIKLLQEEYQTLTTKLEEFLSSNPKTNKQSGYLMQDPEKHPFSIYFSQHTQKNSQYTFYMVHIGERLTPINNIVGKTRIEEGKINSPSDLELKKIETTTPIISSNALPGNLASKLAIKLYNYLSDELQPCEINYRTISKFDKVFKETGVITFDNRKRYHSSNNRPKTTPPTSSACHISSTPQT